MARPARPGCAPLVGMAAPRASRAPRVVAVVSGLLAPARCLACRARAQPPWCRACRAEVRQLAPGCPRCASPRGAAHACWPADAPVAATIAVYDYRGPVRSAVVTAKLARARAGWAALAPALASRVRAIDPLVDVVTWVTTPPDRVRERGFDHAALLAAQVGAAIGVPVVRLLDAEQLDVGHDRYRPSPGLALPGTHVLLVDDVCTTGATAVRAARALQTGGADRIVLAVLARAGSHQLGTADPARPRPQPRR